MQSTVEVHSDNVFEQILEENCVKELQGYQVERCLKQKEQQLQRQGCAWDVWEILNIPEAEA